MGYGYDHHGHLACDGCGTTGGVRKRRCPFKVRDDNLRSAERPVLDYCTAPALCQNCVAKEGGAGKRGVHKRCAEPARARQAEYDAIQARLDAGEWKVVEAEGGWHHQVPNGMVRVTFGRAGGSANGVRQLMVPQDRYDPRAKPWYSDYVPGEVPDAAPG
jgi:hypothetical protein